MQQSPTTLYSKLLFLSSIEPVYSINQKSFAFSQDDLFEICQYIEPQILEKNKNLNKKLSEFRHQSGDTCLHIAAKASNKELVKYLLSNQIVNPNEVNNKNETALISLLAQNEDKKADQIGYVLEKYTDLTIKNNEQQRAFEIEQAKMDPSRARLLKYLKKNCAGK